MEETQLLNNEDLSEKEAVKKLIELRCRKDVRTARLADARKKIDLQVDLIQFDIGEPLRLKFACFAHALLTDKQREVSGLFGRLFGPNPALPVTIPLLVHASLPVVIRRQLANWCNSVLPKDQTENLAELRVLPGKWLQSMHELLDAI